VILLALIKEDVIESDAVAVEIGEVFEMWDVALVAVEAALAVLLQFLHREQEHFPVPLSAQYCDC
jgi:hypothetical protein